MDRSLHMGDRTRGKNWGRVTILSGKTGEERKSSCAGKECDARLGKNDVKLSTPSYEHLNLISIRSAKKNSETFVLLSDLKILTTYNNNNLSNIRFHDPLPAAPPRLPTSPSPPSPRPPAMSPTTSNNTNSSSKYWTGTRSKAPGANIPIVRRAPPSSAAARTS